MYRISLFPECAALKRAARLRSLRLILSMSLLILPVLLVGAEVVSYLLLGNESRLLRSDIVDLSANVLAETPSTQELTIVQHLVGIRSQRLDWSPKLAVLTELMDPSLELLEIRGDSADRQRTASLQIEGRLPGAPTALTEIYAFIQRLREDPRLAEAFPSVKLGSFRGGPQGEFLIDCKPGLGEEP